MDGSELLLKVRQLYPDTVRIILSGQCSRNSVLDCVGVAHQFLNKPCDPKNLMAVLRRVCAAREYFRDPAIRTFITGVQRLPSQPARCAELTESVCSGSLSPERVATTIAGDVAMCAKIVQLVSSGFFGTPQHVSDVAHATALLGLETITALLESGMAFLPSDTSGQKGSQVEMLNRHSIAVAAAAKQIAGTFTTDQVVVEAAHLAGMLHEVGDLARLSDAAGNPAAESDPEWEAPPAANAITRADSASDSPNAGGYLAALWGMPEPIVQAIGYHKNPRHCPITALRAVDRGACGQRGSWSLRTVSGTRIPAVLTLNT